MVMFPKGASKGAPPKVPPVDPLLGSLVQYEDEAVVLLAVVIGTKKDKLVIFNQRGRELELTRPRLYVLPGRVEVPPTSTGRVETLNSVAGKIDATSQEADIAELWSFVHDEPKAYSVAELSNSYFGSDSLERHGGLRVALIREKVHFKRDRDSFEPRSPEVVAELRKGEETKRKKVALRETTLQFFELRAKDSQLPIPNEVEENLRLIGEVAAGVAHTDPAKQKEAKDLVALASERLRLPESAPLEKRAFDALVKIGYFHRDTNLSFIRHDIPVNHPAEALQEVGSIRVPREICEFPEHERTIRVDLTNERAFTIDDESTRDMDDAISVRQTQDGFELGIHITDVTWAILPETALDRSARRRATSVYCADQTVNMLPNELSEASLSLVAGVVRPCVSVLISLDQNLSLLSSRVTPSFVRVYERLTYDEVDRRLEEGESTLLSVHDIAAAFEEERLRNGAVKVQKREVVPFLEGDGSVRLLEIEEDSPARALVAEMMVLANSVMARFAADHGIPVLYRGQERPEEEERAPVEAPEGPAKDFMARTKLKKSTTSLDPQYHAGLALEHYIQATSPIRRYLDLVHQRQFISYFRSSKPWLSREELETLAFEVEHNAQSASVASRETRRYWLLRYLEQRGKKIPIEGTVVRVDTKSPLIELDEIYITVFARLPKAPKLGDRLSLKISALDPATDYIRLEMA